MLMKMNGKLKAKVMMNCLVKVLSTCVPKKKKIKNSFNASCLQGSTHLF